MIPVCSGTQILAHSYGFQSHTRQYLDEEVTWLLPFNTLLLLCYNKYKFALVGWISDSQSYHSSSTDLCSCYYQSVHSQSHSWPLSGNGMSPLCWYTALLHDSCWHPVNTRWYLRRFECRTSVIVNFYNLFRYTNVFRAQSKWNISNSMFREDIPSQDFPSGLSL